MSQAAGLPKRLRTVTGAEFRTALRVSEKTFSRMIKEHRVPRPVASSGTGKGARWSGAAVERFLSGH
jgi:hypothetical protein